MTVGRRAIDLRSRPFRHALTIAVALLAWLSAGALWLLQDSQGPRRHRVNVRFAENVSADARRQLEEQRGLTAGEDKGTRTWSYLLADQSPTNIRALLQSPLVEDTAHIDLDRMRVRLDRPDIDPRLRELLERQWLPYGAWLLTAVGLGLMWTARSTVRALAVAGGRRLRTAALDLPDNIAGAADTFKTLSPRQEAVAAVGLCALFLAPLLLYGPGDDEELALGIFSSQIYYRDLLLHGRWSYWLANLGFGTPMPLGQRLDFHPVFALGSLISLRVALSALFVVQVGVMAVYFRRLLAACGLTPGARLVFLALYLYSMVSYLLFNETDWVSCAVPWTLYPVLVYYLRDAFMGGAETRWWLTTVRLGLLFSLWVLNAHPGYVVPLFIVLAAYSLAAAPRTVAVYGALALAGVFALAASAERIYFLVHESGFFPPGTRRLAQAGYSLQQLLTVQVAPLLPLRDMRQPFVGAVIGVAAVAAPFWWRRFDRHVRACIVACLVAAALGTLPSRNIEWTGLSGVWLFRDPMVFFGLLSAAAVAQSGLRARRGLVRVAVMALLALQCVQQYAVMWPGVSVHWAPTRLEFYRHQGHPTGVGKAVADAASRYGPRLYLSLRAQDYTRGHLSVAGIHVVTDYALLGLDPVTAWFKNVATDRIHPSWAMMHGYIWGQRAVIENATLLDVLGINLVVAATDEGLAPPGLRRVDQVRVTALMGVDVFANPDAWPQAVLLSPDAREAALPVVEGCGHTAALCRDYTALAATRLPQDVSLTRIDDGYRVRVPASDTPRLLFLSAFYRPEWVATAGDRALTIEPIANAFIGVTVPPGTQDIELAFRPPVRVALTWLSVLSLIAMLIALGAIAWHGRTRSGA